MLPEENIDLSHPSEPLDTMLTGEDITDELTDFCNIQ